VKRLGLAYRYFGQSVPLFKRLGGRLIPKNSAFWRRVEKVGLVSISGAKGKKLIGAQQWKSQAYRQARAERSAIESLLFTLKEGFEFGEMVRRTHENVLAEMLEKVLAYNISQIIRLRKKLLEPEQMQPIAA
jgi:hypothetical protein